eukprot:SAG22_NODE_2028_length_3118_cov_1.428619_4_plen_249_part_00
MPFATLNGAKLWYDDWGGAGEPVLLHHGYTACRENWGYDGDPTLSAGAGTVGTGRLLHAAGYRVLWIECRGAGESEHKPPYSIEQYALDVVALLDFLGVPNVTFAGHSMGGGIGYQLAVHHADRLSRLVLMAPIGAGDGPPERLKGITAESYTPRDPQPAADDADESMLKQRLANAWHPAETAAWFRHRIDHAHRCGHFPQTGYAMQTLGLRQHISEITMPVLMLAGAQDGLRGHRMGCCRRTSRISR